MMKTNITLASFLIQRGNMGEGTSSSKPGFGKATVFVGAVREQF